VKHLESGGLLFKYAPQAGPAASAIGGIGTWRFKSDAQALSAHGGTDWKMVPPTRFELVTP
jgi:hypothetical protein